MKTKKIFTLKKSAFILERIIIMNIKVNVLAEFLQNQVVACLAL